MRAWLVQRIAGPQVPRICHGRSDRGDSCSRIVDGEPHAALTNAEQSTPATSGRGALRVHTLPASVPLSIRCRKFASEPWQPQQYGTPRTSWFTFPADTTADEHG